MSLTVIGESFRDLLVGHVEKGECEVLDLSLDSFQKPNPSDSDWPSVACGNCGSIGPLAGRVYRVCAAVTLSGSVR